MSQLAWQFAAAPAFKAEDFLVSPSNAAAHALVASWPRWPSPWCVIQGAAGSGKTHLAHLWAKQSGAILLAPEMLGSAPSSALLGEHTRAVVDDAARADPQGLFHLCNEIRARSGALLMTLPSPPEACFTLPDLLSRLKSAAHAALLAPDDALLSAVLAKHFSDRQLRVEPEVIAYLVPRIERSFAAARLAAETIDAAALAQKRAVTLPLVKTVLELNK